MEAIETQHTKGPWYISTEMTLVEGTTLADNKFVETPTFPVAVLSDNRYDESDPEQICLIGTDIMSPHSEAECIANARLIASAPTMHEALQAIAAIAEGSTTANSLPNIAKIARAALATTKEQQ